MYTSTAIIFFLLPALHRMQVWMYSFVLEYLGVLSELFLLFLYFCVPSVSAVLMYCAT